MNIKMLATFAFLFTAILASTSTLGQVKDRADDAEDSRLDRILATKRWREGSYGISIRPPLGSVLKRRTGDDAVLRIEKDRTYVMTLYLKQTRSEMKITNIYETAREQMAFLNPTAAVIQQRLVKPSGRPGWIQYFGVNYEVKNNKPEAQIDRAARLRVAKDQYETAVTLKNRGRDIPAYRLFRKLMTNSPDRAIALHASRWAKSLESDFAFMARFRKDEAIRQRTRVQEKDDSPWVLGQGFMQIDPHNFVMVKLEVTKENFESIKPVFEGVIRSLRVDNPQEIDDHRKELIKAGDAVKGLLTFARLKEVIRMWDDRGGKVDVPHAELWQRIVQDEDDVGWMRTVFSVRKDRRLIREIMRDPITKALVRDDKGQVVYRVLEVEDGVEGIGVDVQARILMGTRAIDTETSMFLSGDRTFETWATRTTVRDRELPVQNNNPANPNIIRGGPAPAAAKPKKETTWLESGMRNNDQITIIREGPTAGNVKRFLYVKPKDGYLSQPALYLISPLLPRDGDNEYAFYSYYPNTGTISFRTVRCVGKGDNSFTIYSRPAPDQAEQISEYNQAGLLTNRSLSEGRDVVPTTRQELARIWKVDLPKEAPTVKPVQPGELPSNRVPR